MDHLLCKNVLRTFACNIVRTSTQHYIQENTQTAVEYAKVCLCVCVFTMLTCTRDLFDQEVFLVFSLHVCVAPPPKIPLLRLLDYHLHNCPLSCPVPLT